MDEQGTFASNRKLLNLMMHDHPRSKFQSFRSESRWTKGKKNQWPENCNCFVIQVIIT